MEVKLYFHYYIKTGGFYLGRKHFALKCVHKIYLGILNCKNKSYLFSLWSISGIHTMCVCVCVGGGGEKAKWR